MILAAESEDRTALGRHRHLRACSGTLVPLSAVVGLREVDTVQELR